MKTKQFSKMKNAALILSIILVLSTVSPAFAAEIDSAKSGSDGFTYYFLAPDNFFDTEKGALNSDVGVYWWYPDDIGWPGYKMTAAPEIGKNVFKIENVPENTATLIFNAYVDSEDESVIRKYGFQSVNVNTEGYEEDCPYDKSVNTDNFDGWIYVFDNTTAVQGTEVSDDTRISGAWFTLDNYKNYAQYYGSYGFGDVTFPDSDVVSDSDVQPDEEVSTETDKPYVDNHTANSKGSGTMTVKGDFKAGDTFTVDIMTGGYAFYITDYPKLGAFNYTITTDPTALDYESTAYLLEGRSSLTVGEGTDGVIKLGDMEPNGFENDLSFNVLPAYRLTFKVLKDTDSLELSGLCTSLTVISSDSSSTHAMINTSNPDDYSIIYIAAAGSESDVSTDTKSTDTKSTDIASSDIRSTDSDLTYDTDSEIDSDKYKVNNGYTYYFLAPDDWYKTDALNDKIGMYWWTGHNELPDWPGAVMEPAPEIGQNVFKFSGIDPQVTTVIFTNYVDAERGSELEPYGKQSCDVNTEGYDKDCPYDNGIVTDDFNNWIFVLNLNSTGANEFSGFEYYNGAWFTLDNYKNYKDYYGSYGFAEEKPESEFDYYEGDIVTVDVLLGNFSAGTSYSHLGTLNHDLYYNSDVLELIADNMDNAAETLLTPAEMGAVSSTNTATPGVINMAAIAPGGYTDDLSVEFIPAFRYRFRVTKKTSALNIRGNCTSLTAISDDGQQSETLASVITGSGDAYCGLTTSVKTGHTTSTDTDPADKTYTYYFLAPDNWIKPEKGAMNTNVGAYWWENPTSDDWPGTRMSPVPEIGENVFMISGVSPDVTTLIFNTYVDAGNPPDPDIVPYCSQTENINTEGYDGDCPYNSKLNTENFDQWIYVINCDFFAKSDFSNTTVYYGAWFTLDDYKNYKKYYGTYKFDSTDTETDTDTTDTDLTSGNRIRFDPGDWDSQRILFYIWDTSVTPTRYATKEGWTESNTWGSRKKIGGTRLDDGTFVSYEFDMPKNHDIFLIVYDPDNSYQTFDCVLTPEAYGDIARRTGTILENPVDEDQTAEQIKFDESGLTARLCITSTGKVQGESVTPNMNRPYEVAKFVFNYQGTASKNTGEPVVTVDTVANAVEAFETTAQDVWNAYTAFRLDPDFSDRYTEERAAEAKSVILPDESDANTKSDSENKKDFIYQIDAKTNTVIIKGYKGSDTEVAIPRTLDGFVVTLIDYEAFKGQTTLTSISIPSSVTKIGENAFAGCKRLKSIVIPDSVKSLGSGAFSGCTMLESAKLSAAIEEIRANSFNNCKRLSSINIPKSVTKIGNEAFYGCTGLNKVTTTTSLKQVGWDAFTSTSWLDNNTESFVVIGDGLLLKYKGSDRKIAIPSTVKKILGNSFDGQASNANSFTKGNVYIPKTVTAIENKAFNDFPLDNIVCYASKTTFADLAVNGNSANAKMYCYPNSDAYVYAVEKDMAYVLMEEGEEPILSVGDGLLGDVDSDKKVTSADALSILRNSAGLEKYSPQQKQVADIDNDGTISSADALAALRFSSGIIENPKIGKPLS